MSTTMVLTLDTPRAKAALARCTRLLLRWAEEGEQTADGDVSEATPSAADGIGAEARRQQHGTPASVVTQIGEVCG